MENNENVTNEVVEQKAVSKKNNTPLMIIAIAVLLILAGVGLIVTGNNNSLIGKKEKDNNQEEEQGKRSVVPVDLTEEEAVELVLKEKAEKYAEEAWSLGEVHVVARGDNGTFLILFDKVYETNTETLQTIITYENNGWVVSLEGWPEGSKDLTEYNFKFYADEPIEEPEPEPVPEPVPEPTEEPVEEPVETPPEEPTVVIEPTEQPQAE